MNLGNVGDSIWILPQNNESGKIFFGWRSIIPAGIFQQSSNNIFTPSNIGNIVVELVDVSGPAIDSGGAFAMWESKSLGGIEEHFNSSDGIDSNDRLEPVPIGSHTHYNYGITKPGNYEVTFRASGKLNPWLGGNDISVENTFYYSVPFSSVIYGHAEFRLSLDSNPSAVAIHQSPEPVEYAPKQVILITQEKEINNINYEYIFTIDPVIDNQIVEPHRIGISTKNPIRFPEGIILDSSPIEIISYKGPGNIEIINDDSSSNLHFNFSENGIYQVLIQAAALDGNVPTTGPEIELTILAGLEPDYSFSEYASSFERTNNLNPGSLKDNGSDWDNDGIADIIEYQLFWEGMDPTIPDSFKLHTSLSENPNTIIFYRDTYKDQLNRNSQNIILEYSTTLEEWKGWSDRNPGFPHLQFELNSELGNAFGRIQRRKITTGNSEPYTSFFRWTIDP